MEFDYSHKFFVARMNGANIYSLLASANTTKEAKEKAKTFPAEKYGFRIDVVTQAKARTQGFISNGE